MLYWTSQTAVAQMVKLIDRKVEMRCSNVLSQDTEHRIAPEDFSLFVGVNAMWAGLARKMYGS